MAGIGVARVGFVIGEDEGVDGDQWLAELKDVTVELEEVVRFYEPCRRRRANTDVEDVEMTFFLTTLAPCRYCCYF